MNSSTRSQVLPLLAAVTVLLAFVSSAHGQYEDGKKRGGKGVPSSWTGKKNRLTGRFYDDVAGQKENEEFAPREQKIRLGDRIRGRTGKGVTHRVLFEAVKGTHVSLSLVPADRKLTLASRLLGKGDSTVAGLRPKKTDPAVLVLSDFVIGETGIYVIEIAFAAAQAGDYLLETSGTFPAALDEELSLVEGRPQGISFGGMSERSLQEVRIVTLERADLRLAVQLVAPNGKSLPLDESTWRSADGRTLIVKDVPIDTVGEFKLVVMDQNRDKGKAKISVSFRNPRPVRKTHEL